MKTRELSGLGRYQCHRAIGRTVAQHSSPRTSLESVVGQVIEWVEVESDIDNKISEVEALIEEQMLSTAEITEENLAALKAELLLEIQALKQNNDEDDDDDLVEVLAITSFAISLIVVTIVITIFLLRLVRPSYVYSVRKRKPSSSSLFPSPPLVATLARMYIYIHGEREREN